MSRLFKLARDFTSHQIVVAPAKYIILSVLVRIDVRLQNISGLSRKLRETVPFRRQSHSDKFFSLCHNVSDRFSALSKKQNRRLLDSKIRLHSN